MRYDIYTHFNLWWITYHLKETYDKKNLEKQWRTLRQSTPHPSTHARWLNLHDNFSSPPSSVKWKNPNVLASRSISSFSVCFYYHLLFVGGCLLNFAAHFLCSYFIWLFSFYGDFPIRQRRFNRNWCFLCRSSTTFSGLTCFTIDFLWTCENRNSAFPWSSSNPAIRPAPAPISFAHFMTRSKYWAGIGPPL